MEAMGESPATAQNKPILIEKEKSHDLREQSFKSLNLGVNCRNSSQSKYESLNMRNSEKGPFCEAQEAMERSPVLETEIPPGAESTPKMVISGQLEPKRKPKSINTINVQKERILGKKGSIGAEDVR
ncbi:hypothetical protein U1Q18_002867 [Sarracenia purpurea var. burkii]